MLIAKVLEKVMSIKKKSLAETLKESPIQDPVKVIVPRAVKIFYRKGLMCFYLKRALAN